MLKESPAGTAGPKATIFRTIAPGVLVFGATLLAYLPALWGEFIWNDSDYVTAPALRSLHGLARIWTELGATEQYYPLLHSAFWGEHRLWGDQPLGYHIITLLLHAGSAVLFALILRRLFVDGRAPQTCAPPTVAPRAAGRAAGAPSLSLSRPPAGVEWLAALLFALHPVHVESVAWITEQKNTLSLAFYLAAVLVYLQFDATRRPRAYLAALMLFLFSLLCKTVTATLPATLLVVFWWQRGRLDWRRDVRPLLPWLVLGAAAGLFSSWVEQTYIGAAGAEFRLSVVDRGLVAGRAIWFYLGKLAWPFGLNFVYPRWTVDATVWWQWLFPFGVVAVGAALWALRRRTRGPLAAFLLFTGSLFPVLGFVNLFGARYSWVWDHWQYLPDLGLLALAAAALAQAGARVGARTGWPALAPAAALAGLLGALTWAHCGMFHDNQTLYRATLARNPGCWMAHNNLGMLLMDLPGRVPDAIVEYQAASRLRPDDPELHNNLGVALAKLPERLPEAIDEYEAALRLRPDYPEAHNNLGTALTKDPHRLPEAIDQFKAAIRINPKMAEAYYNLGTALAGIPDRLPEAITAFGAELRLRPDDPDGHNNLGLALAGTPGRRPEAIAEYQTALRLKPDYAEVHNNLGIALADTPGRLPEALAQFETALRLKPDYAEAHNNLGIALLRTPGREQEALAHFEAALRTQPDLEPARQIVNLWRTAKP